MQRLSKNYLHIISFDVPYPPDYGGVVDVFFKLKALSQCGAKIILHCYEYGRQHNDELNKFCIEVNYYPRNISKGKFLSRIPYIVSSRSNEKLLQRLLKDDYPILMEGLHTTFFLNDARLKNRFKMVRTHNIEHEYYKHLGRTENNLFKRSYYRSAAIKLNYYESVLKNAQAIAAISPADANYFQKKYDRVFYLPAFHPNEKMSCKTGKGTFALYHGNLGIAENNEAALFLVKKVFAGTVHQLIISGNKPTKELQQALMNHSNITLRNNDTPEMILDLIEQAHVNILPTFQSTGIKLKLITALFRGRFCIANTPMVAETGLESLCIVADTAPQMIKALDECFKKDFILNQIEERKKILEQDFSNKTNAELLLKRIAK